MREIRLRLAAGAARSVGVRVGPGALGALVDRLAACAAGRLVAVVTDSNVAVLHGRRLLRALGSRGARAHLLVFPAGEKHKTRETKAALEDRLAALGAGREVAIVALGGGVTGDLAGFLAATWQRGVALFQAPTSLLAMVDAAVGGKTGVDLPSGKNLVGAFHQPEGVYADTLVLRTLPARELARGLAEAVKAAVVGDAALFRALEEGAPGILSREPETLERVVERALRVKVRLVARDERDAGARAALHFGHTVGHAIEAVSAYRCPHGEAVALGMLAEARLAAELTGFPRRHADRLGAVLRSLGLARAWPRSARPEALMAAMRLDKKARAGTIRCALPARIGAMPDGDDPTTPVGEEFMRRALSDAAAGRRAGGRP